MEEILLVLIGVIFVVAAKPVPLDTRETAFERSLMLVQIRVLSSRNDLLHHRGNWCAGDGLESSDVVDAAEWGCCRTQEKCYGGATNTTECRVPSEWKYKWQIESGEILCLNSDVSCFRALCECDKALVYCLKKSAETQMSTSTRDEKAKPASNLNLYNPPQIPKLGVPTSSTTYPFRRPVPKNAYTSRSFFNMGDMMLAAGVEDPVKYSWYGNWCGIGGAGQPVDEEDDCCRVHDGCYGAEDYEVCKKIYGFFYPYLTEYEWKRDADKGIQCKTGEDQKCLRTICECDRAFAYCMASVQRRIPRLFPHLVLTFVIRVVPPVTSFVEAMKRMFSSS